MSADATLKAAQSLYEAKLISYPRTDSRHLGTDLKAKIPGILDDLRPLKPAEIGKLDLDAPALQPAGSSTTRRSATTTRSSPPARRRGPCRRRPRRSSTPSSSA